MDAQADDNEDQSNINEQITRPELSQYIYSIALP